MRLYASCIACLTAEPKSCRYQELIENAFRITLSTRHYSPVVLIYYRHLHFLDFGCCVLERTTQEDRDLKTKIMLHMLKLRPTIGLYKHHEGMATIQDLPRMCMLYSVTTILNAFTCMLTAVTDSRKLLIKEGIIITLYSITNFHQLSSNVFLTAPLTQSRKELTLSLLHKLQNLELDITFVRISAI